MEINLKPYYEHNGITIYHGDSRSIFPQISADVIVTDPPYGVGKDYGELSVDDIPTFAAAVRLCANSCKPAVVFSAASRIFDVPCRPQWIGVWRKPYTSAGLLAYPIYPHWDALLFYSIKGDYCGNKGHRSDVFECGPIRPDENGHPTPKPLDLMQQLISFMPAGIVCDPFCGSGTTLLAAKNLNRAAIGIEIEEKYCEIAANRLSQEVFQFESLEARNKQ